MYRRAHGKKTTEREKKIRKATHQQMNLRYNVLFSSSAYVIQNRSFLWDRERELVSTRVGLTDGWRREVKIKLFSSTPFIGIAVRGSYYLSGSRISDGRFDMHRKLDRVVVFYGIGGRDGRMCTTKAAVGRCHRTAVQDAARGTHARSLSALSDR